MGRMKASRALAHDGQERRIGKELGHRRHERVDVVDPPCGPCFDGAGGCVGEVERMRPHQHRRADGERLDQVLSAERKQAAADKREIDRCIVGEHLSHRIPEHDPDVGGDGPVLAPANEWNAARAQHFGHRFETLRVTWHDQQQGVRERRCAGKRVHDQRFLAFTRACGHPQPTSRAEAMAQFLAQRERGIGYAHIEFQVAGDDRTRSAQRSEAIGVRLRLRRHPGEPREHRTRQR